ncbi:hypothetical protein ACFSHR_04475 [Azotobacter chroococcum]
MSSASLSHLVLDTNSEMPLIARVYEVESAEELRSEEPVEEAVAVVAEVEFEAESTRAREAVRPAARAPQAESGPAAKPLEEGSLPFVGQVLAYAPGESLLIQRRLHWTRTCTSPITPSSMPPGSSRFPPACRCCR